MEQEYKKREPRKPRKITARYLDNVAIYYLSRYSSSSANLKSILMRRAYKSCEFHDSSLAEAEELIDELVGSYLESGVLDNEKYAYNLARQLRQKGKSEKQIMQKMYEKMVSDELSIPAIKKIDAEINENCEIDVEIMAAWHLVKRRGLGAFRDSETRMDYWKKDLGSLARAGFSYEIAKQVLEQDEIPEYIQYNYILT